jgi:hypothetical protein
MFYGDYMGDDEPEEDDHSNQQMSGSQFSDDIEDRDEESGESDNDSPVHLKENSTKEAPNSANKPLVKKKKSYMAKESHDPANKMSDNHELMEQIAKEQTEEVGQDQMKFLDMLSQSKLKKNGSMRPLKLTTSKKTDKNKRTKNKS